MGQKPKDIFNMAEIRNMLDDVDRPIAYRRALFDLTTSITATLLLSQAIYWQERVTRKDGWWYKSMDEWQEETGLSHDMVETARKKCQKYLSWKLRDIPARLYWKVNREALRNDLLVLLHNKYVDDQEAGSTQFGGKGPSSLAESADQLGGKRKTGSAENDNQSGEIEPTTSSESGNLERDIHPNINMYTESNTENGKKRKAAEISPQMRKTDTEAEKESFFRRLLQTSLSVLTDENPVQVEYFVKIAAKKCTPEWVRDAVNEALNQGEHNIRAVMRILDGWMVHGHVISSASKAASIQDSNNQDGGASPSGNVNTENTKEVTSEGTGEKMAEDQPPSPPALFTLYFDALDNEEKRSVVMKFLYEALKIYPEDWLRDALKESLWQGKRDLKSVQDILDTWKKEGRNKINDHFGNGI